MYFRIILARDARSCCWRFCVKGLILCFLSSVRLWSRQDRNMWPWCLAMKVSCRVASLVNKWWLVHLSVSFTRSQAVARIAVLTHKVLCGVAPQYLGPLNRVTDISGRRSLRSSGTNRLVVPPFRLSIVGSRALPVAAAKIWNALPDSLVSITSPSSFRHRLKTFLFQRSFSWHCSGPSSSFTLL